MANFKNPFEELGLTPAAVKAAGELRALDLAKAAYRYVSSFRHPDRGGKADDFARVEEAMRILEDPVQRKEFFEEYAGKTSQKRMASLREEVHEQKAMLTALRELFAQFIEAPYVPGSLPASRPGTLLLIRLERYQHALLRVGDHGEVYQTYVEIASDEQRRETIHTVRSSRAFCVARDGRAYTWRSAARTEAEDGMWLLAPSDAGTGTQLVYPITTVGKEAATPFRLAFGLDFASTSARHKEGKEATLAIGALNTGVQRGATEGIVTPKGAAAIAEHIVLDPRVGTQLVVSKQNHSKPFEIFGQIEGGVIPQD